MNKAIILLQGLFTVLVIGFAYAHLAIMLINHNEYHIITSGFIVVLYIYISWLLGGYFVDLALKQKDNK